MTVATGVAKIILLFLGLCLGFGALKYYEEGIKLGGNTTPAGTRKINTSGLLVILGAVCCFTSGSL